MHKGINVTSARKVCSYWQMLFTKLFLWGAKCLGLLKEPVVAHSFDSVHYVIPPVHYILTCLVCHHTIHQLVPMGELSFIGMWRKHTPTKTYPEVPHTSGMSHHMLQLSELLKLIQSAHK